MQELVGVLGVLLAVNFVPIVVATLLCIDEGWHKFWKFFSFSWIYQLVLVLLLALVFLIIGMVTWGFNIG